MQARGLALALALLPLAAAAQTPVPVGTTQSAALDAMLVRATQDVPGVSVAVVEGDRIVYAQAAGHADLAHDAGATAQTRFAIGSITKMITGVCVMQLVERGKLRLDASVAAVLPDVPHADAITIRELLRHTSGLPNYLDEAFSDGSVAHPTTPRAILARIASRPLAFTPGTDWGYSNTDDVVLGLIVEKLTGETLAAYERTHVFAPAGMEETTVGPPPAGVPVAVGYGPGNQPVARYDFSWTYADGDVFSTASDLARFDIALMNGVLVSPATFAQMQANPVRTSLSGAGVRVDWGLSLTLLTTGGATYVGHHGGLPGFEAENEMLPAAKYAMVVLGNYSTFNTGNVKNGILAVVLPSLAAAPTPVPSPGAEDPTITARVRALIAQIASGTIDRAQFDQHMNDAFPPNAVQQQSQAFQALGTLQGLTYLGHAQQQSLRIYIYKARFANGPPITFTLVIDPDGKVAGFGGQ